MIRELSVVGADPRAPQPHLHLNGFTDFARPIILVLRHLGIDMVTKVRDEDIDKVTTDWR